MKVQLFVNGAEHVKPNLFAFDLVANQGEEQLLYQPKTNATLARFKIFLAGGRSPADQTTAEKNYTAPHPPVRMEVRVSSKLRVVAEDGTVLQEGEDIVPLG